jgi:hypothetical protein
MRDMKPMRRMSVLIVLTWAAATVAFKAGYAAAQAKQAEPQTVTLGNVTGQVPGNWTAQPAGGQFRLGQYVIPKAQGDTAASQFILFHFGQGGGGSLEDNVKRWIGMVRQPDGSDTAKVVKRDMVTRQGLRITTVDIPGTYMERPFPMAQEATPRPNYRMLAAVIETTTEGSDGPYYVRLVGPKKSIDAAKAGWDSFIASLKAP